MSGDIASRLRTVSARVSPFETLEPLAATFTVSALSRFSAISNEVRVRVLGSKKRFTTVCPRRAGTFLIDRVPTSFMASAVSRISRISSGDRSPMLSRSFVRRRTGTSSPNGGSAARREGSAVGAIVDDHLVPALDLPQADLDALAHRGGDVLADVVRLDRQLAVPAIDEDD